MNKKIFFFLLLGLVIRLISLNQSLWLDEGTTVKVVQQYSYSEILTKFAPSDFHPPLYYLFMKLWTNVFGYSEIALRMPSLLFSIGAGYILYLIAGIWPAIFFLFNPLIIYYSQEARMYLMAVFFLTGAFYYFLFLIKDKKINKKVNIKNLIYFNIFIFLSLLTFYGSAFFIAGLFVYFLFRKQYKYLSLSVLTIVVYALLISPLLIQQLINAKESLIKVVNWSLVLGKANIKNLFLIPLKFSIGRIDFYPKIIYWLVSGVWTFFVLYHVLKAGIKRKDLLFLFTFPLILGFVISFFTPLLQYFRFIYLIPLFSILLGEIRNNNVKRILISGFIIFSFIYLLIPRFHREDWKSLSKSLDSRKPVYMIVSSSDPLKYYNPNLVIKDLKNLNKEELANKIYVIPYTSNIHGVNYVDDLKNLGYVLNNKKSFRGIELEEYTLLD